MLGGGEHAKCFCCAGMHASISAHLSHEYLMDEETDTWGQNLEEFRQRLGNTAVKERVENMYFTYLFVLRAVMKAAPMLESVDYNTGCQEQDASTKKLMQQLVSICRSVKLRVQFVAIESVLTKKLSCCMPGLCI